MNRPTIVRLLLLVALTAGTARHSLAAAAGAPKKASAAKVSASQLFLRLDAIDKKMDELMKSASASAGQKPVVQMPGPGEGAATKQMASAFYNYGVYMKQASNARMAARAIRDLTLLGGTIMAFAGWESAKDKTIPRTMNNAYKHYPLFSFGVTTGVIGALVAEIVDLNSHAAEAKAAKALMQPLEDTPAKP